MTTSSESKIANIVASLGNQDEWLLRSLGRSENSGWEDNRRDFFWHGTPQRSTPPRRHRRSRNFSVLLESQAKRYQVALRSERAKVALLESRLSADTPTLVPRLRQLEELASLEPNWDGEGATSISAVAVASSAVLVTRAREATGLTPSFISPIADGGLQIEWQTPISRLEVMVAPDGEQAVLLVNIADGASRNVIEEHDISAERAMELMRELCSRWTDQ